jgi:hypothetical protein
MYEHPKDPLLSHKAFYVRMLKHIGIGVAFIIASLFAGMCGYHYLGELSWIDAFVDASMILSGMGPVSPLKNDAVKLFAGIYAIYSGLLFISFIALILIPIFHHMLHKFHIASKKD